MVVVKTAHVVAVVSKEDQEIAPHLLDLAERGVVNAVRVRPDGWPGKVLVTAVSDQKVFESYFEGSRDKLAQVEAVTVPRYNAVAEWDGGARFALSRVVFNPATLGRGDDELQHTLTHEFTHICHINKIGGIPRVMRGLFGTIIDPNQVEPRWIIEGYATYQETQLTNVRNGQPVEIRIDSFRGSKLRGHIDSLSPASGLEFALLPPDNATGNFTKIVQRVPVKIVLDDHNLKGLLRPGMSAEPTVNTKATVVAERETASQLASNPPTKRPNGG